MRYVYEKLTFLPEIRSLFTIFSVQLIQNITVILLQTFVVTDEKIHESGGLNSKNKIQNFHLNVSRNAYMKNVDQFFTSLKTNQSHHTSRTLNKHKQSYHDEFTSVHYIHKFLH